MDNFGYSFHQCDNDWPLFDSVPEECGSTQQPSLVTSEDTDLSDDADKVLPSRHKRSRRFNFRKYQSPSRSMPDGWGTIPKEVGWPVLQGKTSTPSVNSSPSESKWQWDPYEDVWSGSEEELELEMVNQFLMARSQVMSNDNLSVSPQIFLISGEQVHPSRIQCPTASSAQSLPHSQVSSSGFHVPVRQSHVTETSVRPTTTLGLDDSDNEFYLHHLKTTEDKPLGTGLEQTQESREDEKALQEFQKDTQIQSQHCKGSQHTAGSAEGHCQSTLGEDSIAQTFVTVSKDRQFLMTRETSIVTESMPESLSAGVKCKTDYSITVPEIYEYFYTDPEDEGDQNNVSLPMPSKHEDQDSQRRKAVKLLTAIKTIVWKYLQNTKQTHSALVPLRMSNQSEGAKDKTSSDLGALVRYTPRDGSHTMMESLVQRARRGLCQSCTQNDLCLFCFACASWAMRSANSQSDMWKAALLVNLSAISAVRYFRRHVQIEDPTSLALQDTGERSFR
ncbi:uncharacterized protein perm1a [Mobula birostris]|uniref:uncharacterized protein perm1a n=1 Tax=Mobula birostris TaxID=1983395 RepID=UPI003B28BF5E